MHPKGSHWERTLEAWARFPLDSAQTPFPFTALPLNPFPVIDHSEELHYILSHVSPLSKAPNLGVSRGPSTVGFGSLLSSFPFV